ncbi:MAG: cupin domain-containing protein [Rhodospirillales bacterium]
MSDKSTIDPVTDAERESWPKHPIVALEQPFDDVRGSIKPLVDMLMKSAVLIESKAGAIRAQHYHLTDWHYCYVLEGSMEYYHRETGSETEPEMLVITKGQMVFTPPMVDHAMKFPVDCTFLTLSRNPRDQESYEKDVVRIHMIDTDGALTWTPDDDK